MSLKISGIGTRVINGFIDSLLCFLLAFIVSKIYKWYVYYYQMPTIKFGWFFAASVFVYYTILESIFARTPGKWFSHSKVVNKKGFRPSFTTILLRSLIRLTLIDIFFFPFLDKSLHDYVSQTEVIEA